MSIPGEVRPASSAGDRLIQVAMGHYWRDGLGGTGVQQLLDESGTTRGSFYFHFPGGKDQLAEHSLALAAGQITDRLRECLVDGDTVEAGIRRFIDGYTRLVVTSDYQLGCPLAIAALEGAGIPGVRIVVERTFADWQQILGERLQDEGMSPEASVDAAQLVVSSLEGALILARGLRTERPLRTLSRSMPRLLQPGPGGG